MASPLRVLILEDVPDDAELMRFELREAGFELAWHCVDTEAAYLEHLDRGWDVILADYTLTQFDALRALELLKARGRDIPFIVVTVRSSEEEAVECMKRGAVDYLLKDRLARLGPAVEQALEKKRVRDAQRQAEAALRESEERFRSTFHQAGIGIAIGRIEEGTIAQANPALQTMLGYSADELQGRPLADFTHPDDVAANRTHFQKLLDGGLDRYQIEQRYLQQDHGIIWGRATVTLIHDEQGRPQYSVEMIEDITMRKEFEKALIRAREEAEEMSQLKSAFMANISHEMRTQLTVIRGFTELLAEAAPEENHAFVHSIELGSQHLIDIVNSFSNVSTLEKILGITRMILAAPPTEAGSLKLNLEEINIAQEVNEKVQLLRPLAEEKGLELHVTPSSSDVWVVADRFCLGRTLNNLVGNAIKFTERGRVDVEVCTVAERVEVRVSDTGVGISKAFLPQLFDAFVQEDIGGARSYGGMGLGLPITKRLVELMGGTIFVESVPGKGSTFTISFPRLVAVHS